MDSSIKGQTSNSSGSGAKNRIVAAQGIWIFRRSQASMEAAIRTVGETWASAARIRERKSVLSWLISIVFLSFPDKLRAPFSNAFLDFLFHALLGRFVVKF